MKLNCNKKDTIVSQIVITRVHYTSFPKELNHKHGLHFTSTSIIVGKTSVISNASLAFLGVQSCHLDVMFSYVKITLLM